jgi:hypothetical protein|tara:strand:- start:340 stop:492 length:153 start_codon:yes stop_codon:yes gene_type:complete
MKKLIIITIAIGSVLFLSGCAEQILAVPKAGINAVAGITTSVWSLLTGWL